MNRSPHHSRDFGLNAKSMPKAPVPQIRRASASLRDFCKAKAEVIFSGETVQIARNCLNPPGGK